MSERKENMDRNGKRAMIERVYLHLKGFTKPILFHGGENVSRNNRLVSSYVYGFDEVLSSSNRLIRAALDQINSTTHTNTSREKDGAQNHSENSL